MISGNRIRLRAIEPEDSKLYFDWINDDETNQWRGLYHPTSKADAEIWIGKHRENSSDKLSLTILEGQGNPIGFIGLSNICPRSRRAEIWIYIGSKGHWGQGLGEDCVRTLCGYAFEQMNLFRIWLECNPEFENVVRCYEKVGFRREGTLRKAYYRDGAFRDTCIMGLLRDDFRGKSE